MLVNNCNEGFIWKGNWEYWPKKEWKSKYSAE